MADTFEIKVASIIVSVDERVHALITADDIQGLFSVAFDVNPSHDLFMAIYKMSRDGKHLYLKLVPESTV